MLEDYEWLLIKGVQPADDHADETVRGALDCVTNYTANALWTEVEQAPSVEALLLALQQKLSAENRKALVCLSVWCLRLYARTMWTGPELTQEERDSLPSVITSDDRAVRLELSVDGELVEEYIDLPNALHLGLTLSKWLSPFSLCALWWRSRASSMLHRSLVGGINVCLCPQLKKTAVTALLLSAKTIGALPPSYLIEESNLDDSILPLALQDSTLEQKEFALLECFSLLCAYNIGSNFKRFLEEESTVWSYSAELTGRLGIRRTHQVDAIAQLSVDLKSTSLDESSTLPESISEVPRNIELDDIFDANDVLARPQFVDKENEREFSLTEKFYLLELATEKMQTCSVNDELAMNVVKTYITELLHSFSSSGSRTKTEADEPEPVTQNLAGADWALWASALFIRSRAEFERGKWKERSCLQMLTIEEQVARATPPVAERLANLWLTPYPNKWELRREVGRKFQKIGAPLTARDMYAKMRLWTDVIECLLQVERHNEAKDVLEKELASSQDSPLLWYLSGEIHKSEEMLKKSWELSGQKFHRAARQLGQLYLEKGDAKQALHWLSEAVRIKPYQPSTQFTYGCLLMQSGDLKPAMTAFNHVIAHEQDHFEAWSNMGAIHCQLEQWASAKKCFQVAARTAQNKWRIWDSYVKVSFKLDDVHAAFEGMNKLVELGEASQIQIWMLHRLVVKVLDKASAEAVREDLLSRTLEFFRNYFNSINQPLFSARDPTNVRTAFDTEPVRTCLDRYRIWCVLTEAVGLVSEAQEISLKAARFFLRVLEDCLAREAPASLWHSEEVPSYAKLVEELMKLWARTINEVLHYNKERSQSDRFFEASFKSIKTQLSNCSLLSAPDRAAILASLAELESSTLFRDDPLF